MRPQKPQLVQDIIAAIKSGSIDPDCMEDIVYAMHSAYIDHFDVIERHMPNDLESFADSMVIARRNTEAPIFEGE